MNSEIKLLLKNLVSLMVHSEISEIVLRKENGRLSEEEIRRALNEYPGSLCMPDDIAFDKAVSYEIYDDDNQARIIEFDLWYDGEESDLTLSIDAFKNIEGGFSISIIDIHVL